MTTIGWPRIRSFDAVPAIDRHEVSVDRGAEPIESPPRGPTDDSSIAVERLTVRRRVEDLLIRAPPQRRFALQVLRVADEHRDVSPVTNNEHGNLTQPVGTHALREEVQRKYRSGGPRLHGVRAERARTTVPCCLVRDGDLSCACGIARWTLDDLVEMDPNRPIPYVGTETIQSSNRRSTELHPVRIERLRE